MKLHLYDIDPKLVKEWNEAFSGEENVLIKSGNILDHAYNTLVSPANSHGYMDGGIDRLYKQYFGSTIEGKVQENILKHPMKYLPVGESIIIPTGHEKIKYLIVAPTMIMPEATDAEASYRAMKAIIRCALKNSNQVNNVFCPGLGTGVGMVPPNEAAKAMAKAWKELIYS